VRFPNKLYFPFN